MHKTKLTQLCAIAMLALGLLAGCATGTTAPNTNGSGSEQSGHSAQEEDAAATIISNDAVKNAIKDGLFARWDIASAKSSDPETFSELKQMYTKLINAELDSLVPLESGSFEDSEIEALFRTYVQSLKDELEQIEDMDVHSTLRNYNYSVINDNVRNPTLISLVDKLEIDFGDRNENYETILNYGNEHANREMVKDVFIASDYRDISTYDHSTSGHLKITNMVNYEFETVVFKIRFYDSEGVQIDETEETIDYIEADSTFWIPFYCDSSEPPASLKLYAYRIMEKDPTQDYVYIVSDDCKTIDPESIELGTN